VILAIAIVVSLVVGGCFGVVIGAVMASSAAADRAAGQARLADPGRIYSPVGDFVIHTDEMGVEHVVPVPEPPSAA
jgi:hypothetical protein